LQWGGQWHIIRQSFLDVPRYFSVGSGNIAGRVENTSSKKKGLRRADGNI